MDKSNTEMAIRSNGMGVIPHTELAPLPPVGSKFLWIDPFNFLKVINAPMLAAWAMEVTTWRRPALPDIHKRAPKQTYTDVSALLMALIQVASRLSYEEVVDYVRDRPNLALFMDCPVTAEGQVRVIGVGQYWARRRHLGIWLFLLFFIGMVWQLTRAGLIAGSDLVLDSPVLAA